MAGSVIIKNNTAIIQGLNFALQKFLVQAQIIESEKKVLAQQADTVITRIKQRKLKKIINKL
jgi:hypothetical protein